MTNDTRARAAAIAANLLAEMDADGLNWTNAVERGTDTILALVADAVAQAVKGREGNLAGQHTKPVSPWYERAMKAEGENARLRAAAAVVLQECQDDIGGVYSSPGTRMLAAALRAPGQP